MISIFRNAHIIRLFRASILFLITACASSPSNIQKEPGQPSIATKVPSKYNLVEASRSQRPEWINFVPEEKNGLHYLVGLSNYHASEKEARSEAMRHAREGFAKYTGVDISQVDELVRSLYGQDSDIFDATVSQLTKSKQSTDAHVSRIKAKEFYFERFETTQGDDYVGTAYKYWVLVAVPVDEYDRVQVWKANKAALQQEVLESERETAKAKIELVFSEYRSRHNEIERSIFTGEPIHALTLIQSEWNRLHFLEEDWSIKGGYFGEQVTELKKAEKELVGLINIIRSGMIIDTGRFHTVMLAPEDSNSTISVWLWQKTLDGLKPVGNVPLVLKNKSAITVARGTTDMRGRVNFFTAGLSEGFYRINIDSETGPLSTFMAPIPKIMSSVYNTVTVDIGGFDLDSATRIATRNLFIGPAQLPLETEKVVIGPVTYADTNQGSEFTGRLKNRLAEQLSKIEGLEVIMPRSRTVSLIEETIRTRGITAKKIPLGSAATQAAIDSADAALETTYVLLRENVRITLALKEAGTDRLLGSSSALISRETLPRGINLVPSSAQISVSGFDAGVQGLQLEVTTHLGDGQTFREGEKISYFVNTERDAYLLMIYEDVEHNLFQILPNRYTDNGFYRAGSTIQVPSPSDDFEFTITGPFGLEHVWAFAATDPWPDLAGVELDNGLKMLKGPFNKIIESLRRHGSKSWVSYGEAHTMLTTVR